MTDYLEMFPSKYLRADDLKEDVNTVIRVVGVELLENKRKIIAYFAGFEKGLILNKTNAGVVAAITGTGLLEKWVGVPVCLTVQYIEYQGKTVPAIRLQALRKVATIAQQTIMQPAAAQPEQTNDNYIAASSGRMPAGPQV